jgi:exopolyphosphatase/guanosine-5'-triphosphate,3'-diphosphate pyrophosphatase
LRSPVAIAQSQYVDRKHVAQLERPDKGAKPGGEGRKPPPGRYGHIYGALDLGTNNCRLLIARADKDGFRVLDAFSRTVRLGEGLAKSGELSGAAIERSIDAIRICASKMRRRGVTRMRAIATEACRTARNGADFIERVARETGIRFDVIPPVEEARLAARSVAPLLDHAHKGALVFDIGGGSTELIWLDLSRGIADIVGWASMPLGVVTLAEHFHPHADDPATYEKMVAEVEGRFRALSLAAVSAGGAELPTEFHLLGTSGTVTTIAGLHLNLERYDRTKVDGVWLDKKSVLSVIDQLTSMTRDQRAAHPCVGPERAELVIPGVAILAALYRLWPAERLRVADRGLREGMLIALMEGADQEARAHRQRRTKFGRKPNRKPKSSGEGQPKS